MPVMGPNHDFAMRQGDEAFKEIMTLLEQKYHVSRPHEQLPLGKKFSAQWDELEAKLRETVKEMVWTDHCASF